VAVRLPEGFAASGVAAGIKPSGKPDIALMVSDQPTAWAITTTQNRFVAACVERARSLFETGRPLRAIIVNAGNANCATGPQGVADDAELGSTAALAMTHLGGLAVEAEDVLTASTGVIGVPMAMDKARAGIEQAASNLDAEAADAFAFAIRTTDLTTKLVERDLPGGGRIVGMAKGSGMIHPNMATMLAFIVTDVDIAQDALRTSWATIVGDTFNQLTVDGDTSTNDMAVVLSSGRVQASESVFWEALSEVAVELTEAIAADGEGATTLLRVEVTGALTAEEARRAARAVVGSSLVKSAVHGRDPNWGRILAAAGQSGVSMDATRAKVLLQGVAVYSGAPLQFDASAVSQAMLADTVEISLDLAAGEATGRAWGCDLTADYVRINADYTT